MQKKRKKGIKQVSLTLARGKVKVHVPLELNLNMDLLPTPLTSFIYLQLEFTVSTFDDNVCLPFKHSKGTHIPNSGLTQTENYGFLAQDSSCFKKDQSYAVVWFSRKESLLLPR